MSSALSGCAVRGGYNTRGARLSCYSGAGFDAELADRAAGDPLIQLVGLEELYA